MAEDLQEEDFGGQDQRLKFAVFGLFFAGLFLLALGAGIFLFRNSQSQGDDIQIISADSQSQSAAKIVVHVDGAVLKPGVYEMSADSRVSDAVSASGGLSDNADMSRVNLAAKVADGQKIYIPNIGEGVGVGEAGVEGVQSLININTATESQLDTLPGVGPATAQKIITSRPYSSPEELLGKKAVGQSVYEKIKDLITY